MPQTDRIDSLNSGSELHGYIVDRVLGSGAFGITYLANHQHLGSKHVIKEYLPDCAMREHSRSTVSPKSVSDRDLFTWGLKSFFDEAKLLHQLSHPHIVKVTDLLEANGTAYFVMPYLRGITFHEWIKFYTNPRQEELEAIFVPLLEGLKYIHDKGLLHRDVKPENIYILENGNPILIDFGSARIAIGEKSKALTQVLTPHFAPIEQYRTKGTFTPALDLYGIAACMYQAITGKLPEEAPDRIEEDLQLKLAGSEYENRYAANFLRAIDKSLSVYAKDRHQDGFAFQKDLVGQHNQPVDGPVALPQQVHSKADHIPPETVAPPETDERLSGYKPVIHSNKASHDFKSVSIIAWIAMVVVAILVSGHFLKKYQESNIDDHVQSTQPAPERRQTPPPVERRTEPHTTVLTEDDAMLGTSIELPTWLQTPDGYVYRPEDKPFHGHGAWTSPDGDKYVGEFKDGKFHGQGTLTYSDGRKYVGSFLNDMRYGQGTWTNPEFGKYVGEFKDDIPYGQGKFLFIDGDEFVGEFKDGNFHGLGTYTHADGRKYVGSFVNDKRHGQGTWTHPDGDRYVGEYRDGLPNGQGTLTLPSGAKYVGEFKDDNFHGQGTFTHADGSRYVGEWKDGLPNGQGTLAFLDGDRYVGEVKDGKFHGQGTFTHADGRKYVGSFVNDKRHGQGTWTHPDGDRYVGEYRDGLPNGQGTLTLPSGAKYVGEFKDDNFHGQGTWTHPGGEKYVGGFKDDKFHGRGTFTFPDGRRYIGEFKDDKFHGQGIGYNSDGSIYFSGQWRNDQPVQ